MSKVREQVAAVEFEFTTGLTPDQVAGACDRAAEVKVFGAGGKFKEIQRGETGDGRRFINYKVRVGAFESARVVVAWQPSDTGCRGSMRIPSFDVSQQKLFMLIPVSPKSVPALKVIRRFADTLRVELKATV